MPRMCLDRSGRRECGGFLELGAGDSRVQHLKQQQSYLRLASGGGFRSLFMRGWPAIHSRPEFRDEEAVDSDLATQTHVKDHFAI